MANQIRADYRSKGLVFRDDAHLRRWLHAIGPEVVQYELKPGDVYGNGDAADPPGWTATVTEVGAGTTEFAGSTEAGAIAELITAANENDGGNWQLGGEAFELTADQELYFGMEFKCTEETQCDFFFGLAITDTDVLGGATDSIGFRKVDASTSVNFVVEKDSSETESTGVLTMDTGTYHWLEFFWDGPNNSLTVLVDGAEVTSPALTNLPNNEALRLTLNFLTGEAVAHTVTIRNLRVIQLGR